MAGPGYEVADVFGANLARHRHKAGLSQEELADRASLHHTEISPLETGIWEVAEPVTGRFRDGGGTR